MISFILLTVCVINIQAQQPNRQPGQTQNFPNNGFQTSGTNINGLNNFPVGPGIRPGTNINLQGQQGMSNNFGGTRGFSSPFGPFGAGGGAGRMPLSSRGFGSPFFRPGMGPAGRPTVPISPMAMVLMSLTRNPNNYRYATCVFNDTSSTVKGRADFRQFLIGEGRQRVNIRIQISGLPQSMSEGERGIHVHEFGDIGDGCARVGPHFNPNQTPHGSQRNFAFLRHVGDLGNIRQSAEGLVSTQYTDSVISLEGVNSVVGRALVIKFERDDLGQGNNRESQVNGNTHNPIACCTIGRTTARNWYNPMSSQDIQTMAATGMMPDTTRFDANNMNTMNNMNNPNVNVPGVINQNMNGPNTPNFNVPGANNPTMMNPNNPTGQNFNGNAGMNNFNPALNMNNFNPSAGINNFAPNSGMNTLNQPRGRPTNFGSGTFFPGSTGQTFNFNTQGKKK